MKSKLHRLALALICVAGMLCAGNVQAQGLIITVAAESVLAGPYITLGDIASINGEDTERINSLRQLKLGHAPSPGQSVVLNGEILSSRLAATGTDLSGINWLVPPQVKMTALSQLVSSQLLTSKAEQYLKAHLTGDVTITAVSQPSDRLTPPGEIAFKLELPYGLRYNTPTTVNVGVNIAGQEIAAVQLRFAIKKYENVAVAASAIAGRELITADNITFERRDIGRLPAGYFTGFDKILGLTVKRPLAPGTAIVESMLEKPLVLKRGKAVTIVAITGGIQVAVPGIALQDGSEGQLIRIQNANSKRMINALVVDATTVQVPLYSGK